MPESTIQFAGEGIEGRKTHPIHYVLLVVMVMVDHHLLLRKSSLFFD